MRIFAICAMAVIVFIGVILHYETSIEQTAIKNRIVLAEWEDLAGDYAELTEAGAELLKKRIKRIWELKALLKKCRNNRYYRVRSN